MIRFLTPQAGTFGLGYYMADYNRALREHVEIVTYESLLERENLPIGPYALTAFDQLTPSQIAMVRELHAAIEEVMPSAPLLNDPSRVLLRGPLLRALHAAGRNDFTALPANDDVEGLRYPVFVREANQHTGGLTDPLPDARALRRALTRLRVKGFELADLLVVEFCDTSDERGLYGKYSAYVVGKRVIPRSLTYSDNWITKHGGMVVDEKLAQIGYEYVETNPHEAWLLETFAFAGVDYGRIDYGMLDGRPQVWEINLNPTVGRGPRKEPRTPAQERARALRVPMRKIFDGRFRAAWAELDHEPVGEIPWRVGPSMRRSIAAERRARERIVKRIRRRERLYRFTPVRALARSLSS